MVESCMYAQYLLSTLALRATLKIPYPNFQLDLQQDAQRCAIQR